SLQTGMDNIRGIVGCPATGLTPRELIDTAPIALAFQRIFLGNKAFTNLPRKFNVTITGCPDNCTTAETQDIAMTPALAHGERVADHVGVFRQRQPGLNYVGLKTPVGRITADQLLELARLAEVYGAGELRVTPLQNVLLPHVPDGRLGSLLEEPLLRQLPYNPSEAFRGVSSCTGTDFCNLALIDTKTRALALARDFERRVGKTRPIAV